jgi:dTDP-4-dehydrorhamnose 3,5-epimerase
MAKCEVICTASGACDKVAERVVIWNDPEIGIGYPALPDALIMSDRDKVLLPLRDLLVLFHG